MPTNLPNPAVWAGNKLNTYEENTEQSKAESKTAHINEYRKHKSYQTYVTVQSSVITMCPRLGKKSD